MSLPLPYKRFVLFFASYPRICTIRDDACVFCFFASMSPPPPLPSRMEDVAESSLLTFAPILLTVQRSRLLKKLRKTNNVNIQQNNTENGAFRGLLQLAARRRIRRCGERSKGRRRRRQPSSKTRATRGGRGGGWRRRGMAAEA